MFRDNAVPFIPADISTERRKLILDYDPNQNKQAATADMPKIQRYLHRSMNVI